MCSVVMHTFPHQQSEVETKLNRVENVRNMYLNFNTGGGSGFQLVLAYLKDLIEL